MKRNYLNPIVTLLLSVSLININLNSDEEPKQDLWCQTDPVPDDGKILKENGGTNWGKCNDELDEETGTIKGEYTINVYSSDSPKGSTNGSMKMILIGDAAISEEIMVTNHGIIKSQILKTKIKMGIVGTPWILKLQMDQEADQLCKKIQILIGNKTQEYSCDDYYKALPNEGWQSLSLTKRVGQSFTFNIKLKSKDAYWVKLQGDKGNTHWIQITDVGFDIGAVKKDILAQFVGNPYKVTLYHKDETKPLVVENFTLNYKGKKDKKITFNGEQTVVQKASWEVPQEKKEESAPVAPMATPPAATETQNPEEVTTQRLKTVNKTSAKKYFDGSCLDEDNYKSVKDITCDVKFNDLSVDFEENFDDIDPKTFPNLKHVYLRCIKDCSMEGEVVGLTIHPRQAHICRSAIADRAIDHTGGVIVVTMTKAQSAYDFSYFPIANKINVTSLPLSADQVSTVSFVVAKVDSPRMMKSNVRIMKDYKVSAAGRLEIKVMGYWTTIMKANEEEDPENRNRNERVARGACKYLGQVTGKVNREADVTPVTEVVPQVKQNCEKDNKKLECTIDDVTIVDHGEDLHIICLDIDPNDPRKPEGYQELNQSVFGRLGTGKQPIIYFSNVKWLVCASALAPPEDEDAEDPRFALATKFCQAAGYPQAKPDGFVKADDNLTQNDLRGIQGLRFLKMFPEYDNKKPKFKSPKDEEKTTVEECKVVQLVCDGTPGSFNNDAGQKEIVRQNFPPVRSLNCMEKLNSEPYLKNFARGDPGSVFTFSCPENCKEEGDLIGAGLYSVSSNVCKSGIQQSLIDNTQPGQVSVVIGYPTFQLTPGLTTDDVEGTVWPDKETNTAGGCKECTVQYTQAVVPTNTCYLFNNVSAEYFLQTGSHLRPLERKFKSHKAISVASHRQQKLKRAKSLSFGSGYSKQFKSFFNSKNPIFWWTSPEPKKINSDPDEDSDIDISELANSNFLREPGEIFSFLIGVEFDELPLANKQVTIFDFGSDGCYQFIINNLGSERKSPDFQFRIKNKSGGAYVFYSKVLPEVGVKYTIALVFQKSETGSNTELQMNGEKAASAENLDFGNIQCSPDAKLRLANDGNSHPFIGTISQFVFFQTALAQPDLDIFMSQVKGPLIMPVANPKLPGVVTRDMRDCITAPTTLPQPGEVGAPVTPSIEGNAEIDLPAEPIVLPEPPVEDLVPKEIVEEAPEAIGDDKMDCLLKGSDVFGPKGEGHVLTNPDDFHMTAHKHRCPSQCVEKTQGSMPLFGPSQPSVEGDKFNNNIYTMESSICAAAIHMGLITNEAGGNVIQHLTKGRRGFTTLTANGIESKTADRSEVAIFIKPGPEPNIFECGWKLDEHLKLEPEKSQGIECPATCFFKYKNKEQEVQGNMLDGYTADSAVCLAALHADLLADNVSNQVIVKVFKKKNKAMFNCKAVLGEMEIPCLQNGIESSTKEADVGFKFKDSAESCKFWNEGLTPDSFMSKVKKVRGKGNWTEAYDKEWGVRIDNDMFNEEESWLVFRDFDCGNAKLQFNIRFESFDPADPEAYIGVIFRYINVDSQEEFYMLKFMANKVKLVKYTSGNEDFINEKLYGFALIDDKHMGHYRFELKYALNLITLSTMVDPNISNIPLLSEDNQDIHRGQVGLAYKGKVKAFFTQYETKPADFSLAPTHFSSDSIMEQFKQRTIDIDGYCKVKFAQLNRPISENQCKTTVGFCEQRVQDFPALKLQPTRMTKVKKECMKRREQMLKIEYENSLKTTTTPCKYLFEMQKIEFKTGMKVDYIPYTDCEGNQNNVEKSYPGFVNAAKIDGEKCNFEVIQMCDVDLKKDGFRQPLPIEPFESNPKERIKKCGELIPSRLEPPLDQELAKLCNGFISSIKDKDMADGEKKFKWLRRMMCC